MIGPSNTSEDESSNSTEPQHLIERREMEEKKWEDTVLTEPEIGKIITTWQSEASNRHLLLEKQAEATWKIAFETGRREGRKEVMEWVEEHKVGYYQEANGTLSAITFAHFKYSEWEKKLEEWGIK